MKKTVKNAPFRKGQDAKQSAISKLLGNFFKHGTLVTTQTKGKYIKGEIDRLTFKSKVKTEASKNVLLKFVKDPKMVSYLFSTVGPLFDDRVSGFVTIKKIHIQQGDNAPMVRIQWVKEVPAFVQKKVIVAKKDDRKSADKPKEEPKKPSHEVDTPKKIEKPQVVTVKRTKERVVSK